MFLFISVLFFFCSLPSEAHEGIIALVSYFWCYEPMTVSRPMALLRTIK